MASAEAEKRTADAKQAHYEECKSMLREFEVAAQAKWAAEKPFEADAPRAGEPAPEKFFVTFPYPYMNGMLHLGHGFSMSKSEFAARHMRLKGKRVLWPFGLHVTGTPIAACAQKIANEIAKYGNPPKFPEEVLHPEKQQEKKEEVPGQFKAKRGKVATGKPQWVIMQSMGIPESDIPKFASTRHWLDHFPPKALEDCQSYGLHVDYRRSFITTDVNPYYNSFIEWQFRKLAEHGYLKWGKRYSIYSPLDGQPCADHDRASGEGVLPQEYVVVKLVVQDAANLPAFAEFKDIIGTKDVILPGATLRCETVVGQTNCWVSPTITYHAYEITSQATGKKQIFILTGKAARNLAYQGFEVNGQKEYDPTPLFEIEGAKLIGLPISAPHAPFATIYTLPMATITEAKGTGVVMSVPSDSPDDYINLIQLVNKPDYRAKLNLKDEWVLPFPPVPIIHIPDSELGDNSAKFMGEKLKVSGPKDADKLEECKKECYSQGFYKGIMTLGPFKGKKVSEAKVLMQALLTEKDEAISYREPMKEVISRSGDICVVALCDQWYIEYGKAEWKQVVTEHLHKMQCYFKGIRHGFEETLNWLADWPCSRTFGLGTVLPFNKKDMLIDSLSDSTIYMAYYTVAQFFHAAADGSQNLDGSKPNKYGITPDMVSDKTWDFVFRGVGTAADSGLPVEIATRMREEFKYWYPVDLRVSGKDLIQNHLTMFLYNHAAIWPEDSNLWPRSIYCNGHVLVDGEKMSKAKGNFITLRDALKMYGADATRLAIADAGDSLDDANFVTESAKGFVLKLANFVEVAKERLAKLDSYRTGEYNLFDKIFDNALNVTTAVADRHFTAMSFRSAMNVVFFESGKDDSFYNLAVGPEGPHRNLVVKYVETLTLLLAPFAPHTTEHLWSNVLKKPTSVMSATLPNPLPATQLSLQLAHRLVDELITDIRSQSQKVAKKRGPITEVAIYAVSDYVDWQHGGLKALKAIYDSNGGSFPDTTIKTILASTEEWLVANKANKDKMQEITSFIAFTRDNVTRFGPDVLNPTPLVDDVAVLKQALPFIARHSGVPNVVLRTRDDTTEPTHAQSRQRARPGAPTVALPPEVKK
jgi:leucyl-tRNA synthetase